MHGGEYTAEHVQCTGRAKRFIQNKGKTFPGLKKIWRRVLILCCGEALIDFVPLEGVRGYQPCPGGSVFNIAVGLGRLQAPVGFFCKVSTDFFGELLVRSLLENSVRVDYVIRKAGPTTLAFVSLPDEGVEPQYVFYANGAVDRMLELEDLPARLPDEVDVLHFGSISLVQEPGASSYERLMQRESGRRVISLDPNVRPSLIPDREAYRRRFESWVRRVDIVRLSLVDLAFLYPGRQPEAVIQEWMAWGPGVVLLTLGAEGAQGYTSGGVVASVAGIPTQVVDTVGAGDTFLAAGLAYLQAQGILARRDALGGMSQGQLEACLGYAVRAASINCSRAGANPPFLHEMEASHG
jgi:fructokinase